MTRTRRRTLHSAIRWRATDDDSGDTLSYSLAGTDAASFAVVESSGQLKTKAPLDYETKSSYSVEMRADDGFVVASIAVTINVNDVNEAPVFPDGAPSLDVNGTQSQRYRLLRG